MKYISLIALAFTLLASCTKPEPSNLYVCSLTYTAYGRGLRTQDTLYGTKSFIKMKIEAMYISNDSVQRSYDCRLMQNP